MDSFWSKNELKFFNKASTLFNFISKRVIRVRQSEMNLALTLVCSKNRGQKNKLKFFNKVPFLILTCIKMK